MRRLLALVVLVGGPLAAAPAGAQGDQMPTKLWSAYPLVQEVERSSTPSLDPILPPDDSGTAPGPEGAPSWGIWGAAMAACLLALLFATRLLRPVPNPRADARGGTAQLRPQAQRTPQPEASTLGQYAPSPSLMLADAPEAPWRSVVMRTGLLRSRYVVLEGDSPEGQHAVAASRSFWSIRGAGAQERVAEDVWDDLMNDLRASGWEPDPTRRSDFYVLLQPVEPEEPVSIVSTLEAYGGTVEEDSAEA
jgi:hypothetical protein